LWSLRSRGSNCKKLRSLPDWDFPRARANVAGDILPLRPQIAVNPDEDLMEAIRDIDGDENGEDGGNNDPADAEDL